MLVPFRSLTNVYIVFGVISESFPHSLTGEVELVPLVFRLGLTAKIYRSILDCGY